MAASPSQGPSQPSDYRAAPTNGHRRPSRQQQRGGIRDAVRIALGGTLLRSALQFPVGIVVSRLIGPEAAGLALAVLLTVGIANLLVDGGLAAQLVTEEFLDSQKIRRVAGAQMLTALLASAILALIAPLTARLFGHGSGSLGLFIAAASIPIVVGLGATPTALLRKTLNQRRVQLAQTIGFIFGYSASAILLAALGAGPWAVLGGYLMQALITTGLCIWWARERPGYSLSGIGETWAEGRSVLAANISNWAVDNCDNIVVGAIAGPTSLGFYSRPYQLFRAPSDAVLNALQQVLFPAFAAAKSSTRRTEEIYMRGLLLTGFILFPALACLAGIGEPFMAVLYGSEWAPAGSVVTPLAIAMILHAIAASTGPILWGHKRARYEFWTQAVCAALLVSGLIVAARISIAAAAWWLVAIYALRVVLSQWSLQLIKGLNLTRARLLISALLATCAISFALVRVLCDSLLRGEGTLSGIGVFATCAVVSYATFGAWCTVTSWRRPLFQLIRAS